MTDWTQIKLLLAGAFILTLGGGWLEIKSLRDDKLRLSQAAARAMAETVTLRRELAAGQVALMERERQAAQLAAQTDNLRRELEELYNNDEPCQTWADSPVPDPVYRRLRK